MVFPGQITGDAFLQPGKFGVIFRKFTFQSHKKDSCFLVHMLVEIEDVTPADMKELRYRSDNTRLICAMDV
jgi:hypothetical protein